MPLNHICKINVCEFETFFLLIFFLVGRETALLRVWQFLQHEEEDMFTCRFYYVLQKYGTMNRYTDGRRLEKWIFDIIEGERESVGGLV